MASNGKSVVRRVGEAFVGRSRVALVCVAAVLSGAVLVSGVPVGALASSGASASASDVSSAAGASVSLSESAAITAAGISQGSVVEELRMRSYSAGQRSSVVVIWRGDRSAASWEMSDGWVKRVSTTAIGGNRYISVFSISKRSENYWVKLKLNEKVSSLVMVEVRQAVSVDRTGTKTYSFPSRAMAGEVKASGFENDTASTARIQGSFWSKQVYALRVNGSF